MGDLEPIDPTPLVVHHGRQYGNEMAVIFSLLCGGVFNLFLYLVFLPAFVGWGPTAFVLTCLGLTIVIASES